MKRTHNHPDLGRSAAFTLIEMIGVLAIMAIMASVLVPNVLRSMDRAAVRAEAETLKALGEQVKAYLCTNSMLPVSVWPDLSNLRQRSWCSDVATVADLSTGDIAVNRRNNLRVILFDPREVPAQRIILISSMHSGPALPDSRYAPSNTQFDQIWDTQDGQVPPVSSWNGWARWQVLDGSNDMWLRHYLLIERIDLRPLFGSHVAIRLWNRSSITATYWEGTAKPQPIAKGEVLTVHIRPGSALYLSPDESGGNPTRQTVPVIAPLVVAPCYVFDGRNWSQP